MRQKGRGHSPPSPGYGDQAGGTMQPHAEGLGFPHGFNQGLRENRRASSSHFPCHKARSPFLSKRKGGGIWRGCSFPHRTGTILQFRHAPAPSGPAEKEGQSGKSFPLHAQAHGGHKLFKGRSGSRNGENALRALHLCCYPEIFEPHTWRFGTGAEKSVSCKPAQMIRKGRKRSRERT